MRRGYRHHFDYDVGCCWHVVMVSIGRGEAELRSGCKTLAGLKPAKQEVKHLMWRRCVKVLRNMELEKR